MSHTVTVVFGGEREYEFPLRDADACLYAAKRAGRNRLVVHMDGLTKPALCIPPSRVL